MKKPELTDAQQRALDKLSDGKWHSAYELRVSRNTLDALVRRGLVEGRHGLGSLFTPSSINYRLIP